MHTLKHKTLPTFLLAFIILLTLDSCKKDKDPEPAWNDSCAGEYQKIDESVSLTRINLGSCGSQTLPLPLLDVAVGQNPDLFIYLGDNIYADTEDMDIMREKYLLLCEKQEFVNLKNAAPIFAVWDDHDFGYNDAGSEYNFKEESKQNFMEFWGETDNTERMSHLGNYDAKIIGEDGKKVQIILLDTRTFRSALNVISPFNYGPTTDPNASILGAEQWAWLETQLQKDADVRMIVSSIQFCVEYNAFEAWANFPLEQEKMYNLIESTNASGVFFVSGDVHYSEVSKREPANTYPLYDFTSSGLTGTSAIEMNTYRVGTAYNQNNIGQIDINWNGNATEIKYSIIDINATVLLEQTVVLSDIQF